MIVEGFFNLGQFIVDMFMSFFGQLPSYDSQITTTIEHFFNFLFDGIDFFAIFFNMSLIKIMIPLFIAVHNLDRVYHIFMWIVRKVPFVSIK